MLLRQLLEDLLAKSLAPDNRAICFANHSSLVAPIHNILSSQPRMQFPLTHADLSAPTLPISPLHLLDVGLQLVEMMYAVIGNTNRSNEPCLFCFDECTPGAVAGLLATVRGMDEVSVRIKVLDAKDSANIPLIFGKSMSLRPSIFAAYQLFR